MAARWIRRGVRRGRDAAASARKQAVLEADRGGDAIADRDAARRTGIDRGALEVEPEAEQDVVRRHREARAADAADDLEQDRGVGADQQIAAGAEAERLQVDGERAQLR